MRPASAFALQARTEFLPWSAHMAPQVLREWSSGAMSAEIARRFILSDLGGLRLCTLDAVTLSVHGRA
jgi:hypothetical protein